MAQTCAALAAEVQARCGRTGDTVLITTGQIATWFNEAQRDIVNRTPGLHAMTFKNRTSLDTTEKVAYNLADITAGDYTTQTIANVWDVFYLDGRDSARLTFVHTDEFDAKWMDPTHAEYGTGKPHWWTRRGHQIEVVPLCSSGYWDKDLRFDGDFYARPFANGESTELCDLCEADEGLKFYALAQAWRAIGSANGAANALLKARDYSTQYEQWMDTYGQHNDRLLEWDGNLYSDEIEA